MNFDTYPACIRMTDNESIDIKLSEISGYHPNVSELVNQLADRKFATAISHLSVQSAQQFLMLHPISITKHRGKFFVTAGFRSFQIAELKLQQNSKVKCQLVSSKNNIIELAKMDILFSPLVFSLSTKVTQQTEKLVEVVGRDFANEHHSDLTSVRSFTRVHERSR